MLDSSLNIFRAVGEETRLRVLALLSRGELTVTELTQILGQSQPRVSRHLKILADAGVVERHREGSWIFYCMRRPKPGAEPVIQAVASALEPLNASSDRLIARDRERFEQNRRDREAAAAAYFERNAADWDAVRRLHLPDDDIEREMRALLGDAPVGLFVDVGTGAGRMLEAFADLFDEGVGFDVSRDMLAVARANLERAGVANAQVRQGDLFAPPTDVGPADVVCVHQVMHFLAEPGAAVGEIAKLLRPGGRLLISDFAPHDLEYLRDDHAHRRLGFDDAEVRGWCENAGLTLANAVTLSPPSPQGRMLTVKIWLCRAGAGAERPPRRQRAAETVAA
ncbi:MAG: metalloregulator ArsR/SmtB family transcription factor [Pseudomonadota bacterium]